MSYQRSGRCIRTEGACAGGASAAAQTSENQIRRIDGDVRFIHELGHIYEHEVLNRNWNENSQEEAIGWENRYRAIQGCRGRTPERDSKGEAKEGGNPGPPCR